ncbi:hypothetical protein Tco_1169390, partial [Tanacetum coccineum]
MTPSLSNRDAVFMLSLSSGNECSYPGNENNNFGNNTDVDGANIRPSYDTYPMVEVPNIANYNVFVVQPKFISDPYVMEKGDSNVTPDSSDMNPYEGTVDQQAAKYEVVRVLLASLIKKLNVDTEENKKIQKELKKANTHLTHELNQSKQGLRDSKIKLS